LFLSLCGNQLRNEAVKIVKERDHVETKLDPALFNLKVEHITVHYQRRVVDSKTRKDFSSHEFSSMICHKRCIDHKCEKISTKQGHHSDDAMNEVLGKYQWIECFALFDWIFLVVFDLIKSDYVPDSEKDEKRGQNEC